MQLQDLAFPDSGRSLQAGGPGPSDGTISDDSSGSPPPFNHVFIYLAGVGLLLLCALWCISSVRSGLATRGEDANAIAAPVLPQRDEERAGADADAAIQSTLVQRKHAILELFRTSQVTMKVTDEDIKGGTKDQCSNEDIELGVAGGTLALSRAAATSNNDVPNHVSFSPAGAAPPETVPNCCAICLESYQPGEVVAWSSSCKHAFHQCCIARYLSSTNALIGGETPCPSCRQKFCELPEALLESPPS